MTDRAPDVSDRLSRVFSVLLGNYFSDPVEGVEALNCICITEKVSHRVKGELIVRAEVCSSQQ